MTLELLFKYSKKIFISQFNTATCVNVTRHWLWLVSKLLLRKFYFSHICLFLFVCLPMHFLCVNAFVFVVIFQIRHKKTEMVFKICSVVFTHSNSNLILNKMTNFAICSQVLLIFLQVIFSCKFIFCVKFFNCRQHCF